jgi:hypothetical protein
MAGKLLIELAALHSDDAFDAAEDCKLTITNPSTTESTSCCPGAPLLEHVQQFVPRSLQKGME